MDREFSEKRIANLKEMIMQYEDAVLQLESGSVQSYTINTGQTTNYVTRFDINRLQATLNGLLNRLEVLEARLSGSGTIIARPYW